MSSNARMVWLTAIISLTIIVCFWMMTSCASKNPRAFNRVVEGS